MGESTQGLKAFLFEVSNGLDAITESAMGSPIVGPLLKTFSAVIAEAISLLLIAPLSSSPSPSSGRAFVERLESVVTEATQAASPTVQGDASSQVQLRRDRILREKDRVIDFASTEVAVLRGKLEADIEAKRKACVRRRVMALSEVAMLEALRSLTGEANILADSIITKERETLRERLELEKKFYEIRLLEARLGPGCYDALRRFTHKSSSSYPGLPMTPVSASPPFSTPTSSASFFPFSTTSEARNKATSYEEPQQQKHYHNQSASPVPAPVFSEQSSKRSQHRHHSIQLQQQQQQQQQRESAVAGGCSSSSSSSFSSSAAAAAAAGGTPQRIRRYSMPRELSSTGPAGSYAQKVFYKHWASNVPEGEDQAAFTQQSLDKVFTALGYSLPPEQVGSALAEMSPSVPGVISWPVFNQYMTSFVNNNKQNLTKKYVI